MSDPRTGESLRGGALPAELDDDLRALREVTARDLPRLAGSVSHVRTDRAAGATLGGNPLMTIAAWSMRHPWPATGGFAAALVAVLLAVPLSYERTTGQHVSLTLTGTSDVSRVRRIAGELERVLGVRHMAMRTTGAADGAAFTLEVFVAGRSGADTRARAGALAKELTARGYGAVATVTPRRERVSGSVYAYARDVVIRIRTDGKSDEQIAAEISQRLAEAGIANAEVSVSRKDHEQEITIAAPRGSDANAPGGPCNIDVELTQDGRSPRDGMLLQSLRRAPGGGPAFHMGLVDSDGRTATVDVPNPGALSDSALAAEIMAQLRRAGFDLRVQVTNGKPEIQPKQ